MLNFHLKILGWRLKGENSDGLLETTVVNDDKRVLYCAPYKMQQNI